MSDREYLLALSTFVPFGHAHIKLLVDYFGSAKSAWRAGSKDLAKLGVRETKVAAFVQHRKGFNIKGYLGKLKSLKITYVTRDEPGYPENLAGIGESAPYVLYIKGILAPEDAVAIAIVGSRKMTAYGREVTEHFANGLADMGVTIISGLARGVDTVAHRAALAAGGRTVAVIGCGLDTIYPPENIGLAREIVTSGCIVSEYPLGYPAIPTNFPARNRIISGLSCGVVVVEGELKSGTLLTATHAANQGRTVFGVPGQITSPLSGAPHFLIKNGAKFAFDVDDIAAELDLELRVGAKEVRNALPEGPMEEALVKVLANEPLHIDEIVRILTLPSQTVTATLTLMELKGLVRNLGGGIYKKV